MGVPLVSILCPTFNHELYIAEAIGGFLMQKTDFEFEIIIHDDASTDKTAEIVKSYESKYPEKFNNIYQTDNHYSKDPMSVSRILFKSAKGKYIALCEGDDYWTDSNKLQDQIRIMEETNSDCCNTLWSEKKNGNLIQCGFQPNAIEGDYFFSKKGQFIYYHTATRIIKKSALYSALDFFPLSLFSDTPFQIIFCEYFKVVNLMKHTSVYRISGEGIWTSINDRKKIWAHIKMYSKLARYLPSRRRKFLNLKWIEIFNYFGFKNDNTKFIVKVESLVYKILYGKKEFSAN